MASANPSQPEKLVAGARSRRGATVPDKPSPGSILRSSSSGPSAPLTVPLSSVAMQANHRAAKGGLTSGELCIFRSSLPRAKGVSFQGLHVDWCGHHDRRGGWLPGTAHLPVGAVGALLEPDEALWLVPARSSGRSGRALLRFANMTVGPDRAPGWAEHGAAAIGPDDALSRRGTPRALCWVIS